uniref:Uncharacterized protein n=1 Tax=viral metagenome TaxID=1070528 RepID=A0A6M3JLW5_9ZZZZ
MTLPNQQKQGPEARTNGVSILDEIEQIVETCDANATIEGRTGFKHAKALAMGIAELRRLITDDIVKVVFMPLQGTSLGFKTDKDREGGYDIRTVKECLIEALIRGVRATGNEFNIISGQTYLTKNGLDRLVREWPGLTNLELSAGAPAETPGGALVPYRATWLLVGELHTLVRVKDGDFDGRVPIRVNKGMGVDGILGKAKRKILAMIYERLAGVHLNIPEGDVDELPLGNGTKPIAGGKQGVHDALFPNKPEDKP